MKRNKGMGMIKLIVMILFIALIVATTVYFVRMQYHEARVETIKTDMLLVQWKVKSYIDSQIAEKVEIKYLGVKLSEVTDNNLINTFKEKNVIVVILLLDLKFERYLFLCIL